MIPKLQNYSCPMYKTPSICALTIVEQTPSEKEFENDSVEPVRNNDYNLHQVSTTTEPPRDWRRGDTQNFIPLLSSNQREACTYNEQTTIIIWSVVILIGVGFIVSALHSGH
jgi:hypothetical protein